jgi:hypothetical protein
VQCRLSLRLPWAIEEPIEKDVTAAEQTKPGPAIQMLKVKADDVSEVQAIWLDDAPVNLIVGQDLRGLFGVGGQWVVPAYDATASERTYLERASRAR